MKYCAYCGKQIEDNAVICIHCGCKVEDIKEKDSNSTLKTIVKVLLILRCIATGWLIVPLAWHIPMTVSVFNKYKNHEPISTGFKICTILFTSTLAGIIMLCMDDED